MGTFFLVAGTVLFFSGLGCLIFVFASIARRLKDNFTTSIYFRSRSSSKPWLLSICGVILIVVAQGFYWFYSEVGRFIPFSGDLPKAQVSFVYEEYKQPRLVVESVAENDVKTIQSVPFSSDSVALGVEIIEWKKVCQVLGLKPCYRINGIYSVSGGNNQAPLYRLPDHELNGGQSGFISLIEAVGKAFPGELKVVLSQAIVTDGSRSYSVAIGPDSLTTVPSIDKHASLNYSK